jgi:hypothetical protein
MTITFSILAGLVVPFLVSFLKSKTWSAEVKQLMAIGVSLIVGAGVTVIDNGVELMTWQDFVANFGVIFTVANIWYSQYFGNTSINAVLENTGPGSGSFPPEVMEP